MTGLPHHPVEPPAATRSRRHGGDGTLPRLRGVDVLVVLLVTFAGMALLGTAGVVVGLVSGQPDLLLPAGGIGGTVGMWAGLWATLSWRRGWGWREMGFVRPLRSPWHLCWQVPASVAASLVGAALLGTSLGLSPESGEPSLESELGTLDVAPWVLLVLVLCVVVVAPAAEEVLFRRVLLDWLMTRTGALVAVPVTAVAFALVHVVPVAMVYVVFMGLFTALLRLWHGTLWAPLALHAANNGLVVLVAVTALTG